MSWREACFEPDQSSEVEVSFEPVSDGTRVTVEHFGWQDIDTSRASSMISLLRHRGEAWRTLLAFYQRLLRGDNTAGV